MKKIPKISYEYIEPEDLTNPTAKVEKELLKSAHIHVSAPAKINLSLHILGKRSDGYHELNTVMQTIALYDELEVSISRNQTARHICLHCDPVFPVAPEDNLAYRAADLFLSYFQMSCDLTICLTKRIPLAAGLAGGSSDAASVLAALFFLVKDPNAAALIRTKQASSVTVAALFHLAEKLGADVPFCLQQGTALCCGKGEKIYPLNDLPPLPLLVYNPPLTVLTSEAFAFLQREDWHGVQSAAQIGILVNDLNCLFQQHKIPDNAAFKNDFSDYLWNTFPELKDIFSLFSKSGAEFVRFSGSGPTIFAVYPSFSRRDQAYRALKDALKKGKLFASATCPAELSWMDFS